MTSTTYDLTALNISDALPDALSADPLANAGRLLTLLALAGIPGLLLGGIAGDFIRRTRSNGRLLVAGLSILLSTPFTYMALNAAPGNLIGFALCMALATALVYVYYATVYSTVHDVIEPSLRGTAMALYFCAMYLFGGSFGPVFLGYLSERFTEMRPPPRVWPPSPKKLSSPSGPSASIRPCTSSRFSRGCSLWCYSQRRSRSGKT